MERLGERLFLSTALSGDGARSCATCHEPRYGFSGGAPVEHLLDGTKGSRRVPSLFGVSTASVLMWDGRAPDLEHQLLLPLEGAEMRIVWPRALSQLTQDPEIVRLTNGSLDRGAVLTALAVYVRSLDRQLSRFDRFYKFGDSTAITEQELRGFRIFQRKARCSSCHLVDNQTTSFSDGACHVTGAGLNLSIDKGRARVTGAAGDIGAFKTPSLRGVALRPFLLHNGSMRSLREVIVYYDKIDRAAFPNIDGRLQPLTLTDQDIDDLIAFLKSLTPQNDVAQ